MNYALIVVYNKNITDSITYKFLKKYKTKIKIVIFDNSNASYLEKNKSFCDREKIMYYTCEKNIGLSKAYNYIIDLLRDKKNIKYLMIFDDDTILNDSYMNESFNIMNQEKYDVSVPIVIANDSIMSPTKLILGIITKAKKTPQDIPYKKINAINSGMIINFNVFKKIKYNERLFLDYVDHVFIYDIKKNNFSIHIMKEKIIQNSSKFEKKDIESEKFRFIIRDKDLKNYCKIVNRMWFYYIATTKHRIDLFFKNDFNIFFLKPIDDKGVNNENSNTNGNI